MEKSNEDHNISSWGLICLLVFSPLIRGGYQGWAAFLLVGGIAALFATSLFRALWNGSLAWGWRPQDLILLGGLLWVLFGTKRPLSSPEAFDSFLILLGCAGSFFLARELSFVGSSLKIAFALVLMGGLISLVGLVQVLGFLPHGWWSPAKFMASTFVNHNHFAAYLEVIAPLGFLLSLTAPVRPVHRFLLVVSSFSMALGLLLSYSRGAWFALAIATGGFIVGALRINKRVVWDWKKSAALVCGTLATLFLISQPPIFARAVSLLEPSEDASVQTRQAIWQGTWGLVKEHPFIGQGVGSFPYIFPRYRPAGLFRMANYAHNEYLQLTAELGLGGLGLALLGGFLILGRMLSLVHRSRTPWKQALGAGGLMGLVSLAIHSLVDFPWHMPSVVFTSSVVAGLVTGMSYQGDLFPLRRFEWNWATPHRPRLRWILTLSALVGTAWIFLPLGMRAWADGWAHQGQLKGQAREFEAAIQSYDRAGRWAPWRVSYHQELGNYLIQRAKQLQGVERISYLQRAGQSYQKILNLIPHDARSAHALGLVLKELGDLAESDRWLKHSTSRDPHNPLYWKHQGELKFLLGEPAEAAQAFRRARELTQPYQFYPSVFASLDRPDYFVQQGESHLLGGQKELAESAFLIAQEFDAQHDGAQTGLALVALKEGDLEKGKQLMSSIHNPKRRAQWFAGVAQREFERGQTDAARGLVNTSLKLNPSNALGRHLEFLLATTPSKNLPPSESLETLLSVNRPPVYVQRNSSNVPSLVWQPEKGKYTEGSRTQDGWKLFTYGSLHQPLYLPPGKVRFTVLASGTRAKDQGPLLVLSWNREPILTTEVRSELWEAYTAETDVKPGESLLTVNFPNDFNDRLSHEDRDLYLEKIIVTWEAL